MAVNRKIKVARKNGHVCSRKTQCTNVNIVMQRDVIDVADKNAICRHLDQLSEDRACHSAFRPARHLLLCTYVNV